MTHTKMIQNDLKKYGVAYEKLLNNGDVERLDPRFVRMIRKEDTGFAALRRKK